MGLLISVNGKFESPSIQHENSSYKKVEIGKPMSIGLLSFFPGNIKSDWGGKAEIMLSSQIRTGPRAEMAPELINMMLKNYNFKRSPVIQDYGGEVYGDPVIYYTKSYLGQRIGLTIHGNEMDRIGSKSWDQIRGTMEAIGQLALFTPAAPYLAAAGLATNITKALVNLINRNDRLTMRRQDFYFNESNKIKLQAGRYLLWEGSPTVKIIKNNFHLTSDGDADYPPNILVETSSNKEYKTTPYIVLQIDGKKRSEYDNFEIGAGSAKLLEQYGNQKTGALIFQTIKDLAIQVNDATQLKKVKGLLRSYNKSESDEEKALIKEKIVAQYKLFSEQNGEFVQDLIDKSL
jgi:hypothetical protein